MKRIIILSALLLLLAAGCNNAKPVVQNNDQAVSEENSNEGNTATPNSDDNYVKILTCKAAVAQNKESSYTSIGTAESKYTNTKYGYSFDYPKGWYVDTTFANDDFTGRGEKNECMGGDLAVTNYNKSFSLGDVPTDYHVVTMFIFKVDPKSTPEGFINSRYEGNKDVQSVTTKNISINGHNVLEVTFGPNTEDNGGKTFVWKKDDRIFEWHISNLSGEVQGTEGLNAEAHNKMLTIVKSFKLSK